MPVGQEIVEETDECDGHCPFSNVHHRNIERRRNAESPLGNGTRLAVGYSFSG